MKIHHFQTSYSSHILFDLRVNCQLSMEKHVLFMEKLTKSIATFNSKLQQITRQYPWVNMWKIQDFQRISLRKPSQWPFQDPKLKVSTIYQVYSSPRKYVLKYGPNLPFWEPEDLPLTQEFYHLTQWHWIWVFRGNRTCQRAALAQALRQLLQSTVSSSTA